MSQALSLSLDCKTGASVPGQSRGRQEELGQTGLEAKVVVGKMLVDKLVVDKLVVDRERAGCFSLH